MFGVWGKPMVRHTHHTDENAESAMRKFGLKLCWKHGNESDGYYLADANHDEIGNTDGKGYSSKAEAADAAMYIRQMYDLTDSIRRQVNQMAEDRTLEGNARIARLYGHLQAGRAQYEINEFEGRI